MQPTSVFAPSPRRVVIVEDDEALALLLRYNLEKAGHIVETIADGVAALRALIDRPPQLVVLDWNLPRLSGIEILRQLRRVHDAQFPIVMLTARTDSEDRERALTIGVDAYVGKPFAIRDLLAEVARLLGRDQALPPTELEAPVRHRTFTLAE